MFSLTRPKTRLGLDFGDGKLKIIGSRGSGANDAIDLCEIVALPDDPVDDQATGDILRGALKEQDITSGLAGVAIAPDEGFYVIFECPEQSTEAKIIDRCYEELSFFTSTDDGLQIDFQLFKQGDRDVIMACAVPEETLERYIKIVSSAGLELTSLIPHALAFTAAFCHAEFESQSTSHLLLHLERASATCVAFDRATPPFVHVAAVDEPASLGPEGDDRVASEASDLYDGLPPDEGDVPPASERYVDFLTREVRQCEQFLKSQVGAFETEALFLSGSRAKSQMVREGLQRELNKKVRRWNPFGNLKGDLAPEFQLLYGIETAVATGAFLLAA